MERKEKVKQLFEFIMDLLNEPTHECECKYSEKKLIIEDSVGQTSDSKPSNDINKQEAEAHFKRAKEIMDKIENEEKTRFEKEAKLKEDLREERRINKIVEKALDTCQEPELEPMIDVRSEITKNIGVPEPMIRQQYPEEPKCDSGDCCCESSG